MKRLTELLVKYRFVTPAFLGGSDPRQAELRPPSIKAALRSGTGSAASIWGAGAATASVLLAPVSADTNYVRQPDNILRRLLPPCWSYFPLAQPASTDAGAVRLPDKRPRMPRSPWGEPCRTRSVHWEHFSSAWRCVRDADTRRSQRGHRDPTVVWPTSTAVSSSHKDYGAGLRPPARVRASMDRQRPAARAG